MKTLKTFMGTMLSMAIATLGTVTSSQARSLRADPKPLDSAADGAGINCGI